MELRAVKVGTAAGTFRHHTAIFIEGGNTVTASKAGSFIHKPREERKLKYVPADALPVAPQFLQEYEREAAAINECLNDPNEPESKKAALRIVLKKRQEKYPKLFPEINL